MSPGTFASIKGLLHQEGGFASKPWRECQEACGAIGDWRRVGGDRGGWGQSTTEISGVMVTLRARELPTGEVATERSQIAWRVASSASAWT